MVFLRLRTTCRRYIDLVNIHISYKYVPCPMCEQNANLHPYLMLLSESLYALTSLRVLVTGYI